MSTRTLVFMSRSDLQEADFESKGGQSPFTICLRRMEAVFDNDYIQTRLQIEKIFEMSRIRDNAFHNCEKFYNWLVYRRGGIVATVWADQALVSTGLCLYTGTDQHPGYACDLEYIMTHSDFRGRGGAQAVINALLSHAKGRGICCARLTCAPGLQGLYEKLGFIKTGQCTLPS